MSEDYPRSSKIHSKKKKSIRVFVQRKRLSHGISLRSTSTKSNSVEQLTSILEKKFNRTKKNKNIIIVNYKPVFVRPREPKPPIPVKQQPPTAPVPTDIPDVEDPLMFIEMMYQQLFTEDGQLRNGTEPTAFANRVKQMVTQSRRNSMVHRESLSTSRRFLRPTLSEDEESQTVLQKNSRRSSKQSSTEHGDHQQLHSFLNSYRHHQKRRSTTYSIYHSHTPYSIDDTDNEDLDTFSDVNSYRKVIRHSPPGSIDEDTLYTDSKLLCSSGYQSFKSPPPSACPIDSNTSLEKNSHSCPNCVQTSSSSISLIQPIREILVKYLNFILISKNILVIPLFIFFLRQRSMHIGN